MPCAEINLRVSLLMSIFHFAEISERPFEQLSGNSVATVIQLGSPRDPMQDDMSEAACSEGKGEFPFMYNPRVCMSRRIDHIK